MALSELDLSSFLWTALPAVLIALIASSYLFKPAATQRSSPTTDPIPMSSSADGQAGQQKEAFAVPDTLAPPKDDPYTLADLAQYNGSEPSRPILLSIKGERSAWVAGPAHMLMPWLARQVPCSM